MLIGLTGGSGSGKSTICSILKDYNMFIIDADSIAHDIIKKGNDAYNEVINIFGENILDENKEIARKKLGEIVFNNKEKLDILIKITHKYVVIEIKNLINKINKDKSFKHIVIDAPLLIEAELHKIVDEVWVIYADINTRINRIIQRDNITKIQAENRIKSQMSWEELSSYANVIIDNSKDFSTTLKQIQNIIGDINEKTIS